MCASHTEYSYRNPRLQQCSKSEQRDFLSDPPSIPPSPPPPFQERCMRCLTSSTIALLQLSLISNSNSYFTLAANLCTVASAVRSLQRARVRESQRESQRDSERVRERVRETQRERERESHRESQRVTESHREREAERETDLGSTITYCTPSPNGTK